VGSPNDLHMIAHATGSLTAEKHVLLLPIVAIVPGLAIVVVVGVVPVRRHDLRQLAGSGQLTAIVRDLLLLSYCYYCRNCVLGSQQ